MTRAGIDTSNTSAPPPILVCDDQAAAALGVSVRKFHELRAESWMPKAITLGPRLLRWSLSELRDAVAIMPRLDETGAEPLSLAQARRRHIDAMKKGGAL